MQWLVDTLLHMMSWSFRILWDLCVERIFLCSPSSARVIHSFRNMKKWHSSSVREWNASLGPFYVEKYNLGKIVLLLNKFWMSTQGQCPYVYPQWGLCKCFSPMFVVKSQCSILKTHGCIHLYFGFVQYSSPTPCALPCNRKLIPLWKYPMACEKLYDQCCIGLTSCSAIVEVHAWESWLPTSLTWNISTWLHPSYWTYEFLLQLWRGCEQSLLAHGTCATHVLILLCLMVWRVPNLHL